MSKKQISIEAFIRRHRTALDQARPDHHGWGSLDRLLDRLPEADALEQTLLSDRPLLDTAEPSPSVWESIENELEQQTGETDSLEQFIQSNRQALDSKEPDLRVWAAIDKTIGHAKSDDGKPVLRASLGRKIMRIAAAIALLVTGVGIGVWYTSQNPMGNEALALETIDPEYAEMEAYYTRDIRAKQKRLSQFTAYEDHNVDQDLQQLDKMMEELREELIHVPPSNREKVVRALIENYKAKASILERVLERLENKTENPTNSNEYETERI